MRPRRDLPCPPGPGADGTNRPRRRGRVRGLKPDARRAWDGSDLLTGDELVHAEQAVLVGPHALR